MWLKTVAFLSLVAVSFQEHILIFSYGNSHMYGQLVLGKRLLEMGHTIVAATHKMYEEKLDRIMADLGVQNDFSKLLIQSESDEEMQILKEGLAAKKVPSAWESILKVLTFTPVLDGTSSGLLRDEQALSQLKQKMPDFMLLDSVPIINGQFMMPLTLNVSYGIWIFAPFPQMVPNLMASWAPHPFGSFTDRMSFLQRLGNLFNGFGIQLFQNTLLRYSWNMRSNISFPGLYGFQRPAEIILIDSDLAVDYSLPLPPKYVYVGGMHCSDGKPLKAELEDFVQNAELGVFYVALGTWHTELSPPVVDSIVYLMDKLPGYRMIAVHTGAKIDHPSIKVMKRAPQNDILAHPKTSLFLSHCGTGSQMEALYHNVLVLCLPVSTDQFYNAARIAEKGASLTLDIQTLTGEKLAEAVRDMLEDPKFTAAQSRISSIYRNQPLSPLERAAQWVDHVVRFGGDHLQFKGADLWWWQYYLLDVWAFLFVVCFVLLTVLWVCCKRCCCCCCRRRKAKAKKD